MTFSTRSKMDRGQAVTSEGAANGQGPGLKVAYIMSRFPKLTETFVLNEMIAVKELGVQVEVYPLLHQREPTMHAGARPFVERAHFHPFVSIPILQAQIHFMRTRPGAYWRTWWEVLSGTWGSWNFFIGALGILPKAVRFAFEMEQERVDHVHAHFANHPAVAAFIIHRLTDIPFSFTTHSHDLHVERRMLGAKVRAAKFAVTISEFNRQIMLAECDKDSGDKIRVIHCGISPTAFPRESVPKPVERLEIVCVAALRDVKGHCHLIDACRLLADRGVRFRCRLIGDGPLRPQIEQQIASLGLQESVILLGGLGQKEVIDTLAASDVGVLTSIRTPEGRIEGIPVALMEAMATGLPVVASAIGGIPELVEHGHTGLLVPPGDPEAIAGALETLARDGDLAARMGAAGRDKVSGHFNQQASAQRLALLFAAT
jgi:colanic acid/amylovoran biosynthesis glycosyltransferase